MKIEEIQNNHDLLEFFELAHVILKGKQKVWINGNTDDRLDFAKSYIKSTDLLFIARNQDPSHLKGELIGILWLKIRPKYDESGTCVFVYYINIIEKYRRKGYGTKLMKFTEHVAKERGIKWIELSSLKFLTPAIAMYKKLGYNEISILPEHIRATTPRRFFSKKIE